MALAAVATPLQQMERPVVGVALLGDGRESAALVGVLQRLDELRIPVDVITGSGMGGAIAAAFGVGTPLSEIEEAFLEMNWAAPRSDLPVQEFYRRGPRSQSTDGTSPERVGSLLTVPRALTGRAADLLLQRLVGRAPAEHADFAQFPVPFSPHLLDLETGESVALRSGQVAVAVRPSTVSVNPEAVTTLDGRILSASAFAAGSAAPHGARELGAEIVIMVEASEPLNSEPSMIAESLLGSNSLMEGRALADVLILAHTSDPGLSVQELIRLGYEAATRHEEALRTLTVDAATYQRWRIRFGSPP